MDDKLLPRVTAPADVAKLSTEEQEHLCAELRDEILRTVSKTGGHLASNLGVVELTVALHAVLDMPRDTVVWDVGHQCYAHKLLTGRYDCFSTLRQKDGLSGFPQPRESVYDAFVCGHSSTAASAVNGIAKAKSLKGDPGVTVAVIGDGAMTGGLAYEGLSNIGRSKDRVIVVLNDNRMSISANVGFAARHLSRLRLRPRYVRFKGKIARLLTAIPGIGKPLFRAVGRGKSFLKRVVYDNSSLFEDMGFYYLGPVDGHNLKDLKLSLQTAMNIQQPVLLHIETVKGRGYPFAEEAPDRFHGVGPFDLDTGRPLAEKMTDFSAVFGETLERIMEEDPAVAAITAAMPSGTGLSALAARYPGRCFDVGIAEEHAVTFASGLATQGIVPVFAVYSAFLQRAYDQLLNDTSLLNGHVVLAVDRAGVVPADGETHQGFYDIPFLTTIPHTTIYSPADFEDLRIRLRQAVYDETGIAAVRYPKGGAPAMPAGYVHDHAPWHLYGEEKADTLLVTFGRTSAPALRVGKEKKTAVLILGRIWPLDAEAVDLIARYPAVHLFEESSRPGGLGEKIAAALLSRGYCGKYTIHAADGVLGACTTAEGLAALGLDEDGIRRALG